MAKDFEWDYAAAGELLLKSDEIASVCEEEAARMTRATGVEYIPDIQMCKQRVRAGGYDQMSSEDHYYRKRKNGIYVRTERKTKVSK